MTPVPHRPIAIVTGASSGRAGRGAMLDGDSDVVDGWKNKLQAILTHVTPSEVLAAQHRKIAEPGSARH